MEAAVDMEDVGELPWWLSWSWPTSKAQRREIVVLVVLVMLVVLGVVVLVVGTWCWLSSCWLC